MSLAATIKAMAAAGCSVEQIAAVAAQFERSENEAMAAKRAKDAERKRRSRAVASEMSRGHSVTPRDIADFHGHSVTSCDEGEPRGDIYTTRAPALFPVGLSNDNPPIVSPQKAPQTTENRKTAQDAAAAFERFWMAWPNKTGKPAAVKAFFKVWRETDAIIAGVNRYIRDKPADRPWLNPSTFLNQRRWEDQPAPVANARAGPAGEKSGVAKLLAEAYGIDERDGTQAQGNPSDFRALPVPYGGERIENHGDDGSIFGRLLADDG